MKIIFIFIVTGLLRTDPKDLVTHLVEFGAKIKIIVFKLEIY